MTFPHHHWGIHLGAFFFKVLSPIALMHPFLAKIQVEIYFREERIWHEFLLVRMLPRLVSEGCCLTAHTSLGSTLESVTAFTKKMQFHKNCSNFSQFLSYARIPKVPLAIVLPKVPLAILALFLIICAPKRSARAQGLSTTDSICMQRKGL